MSSPFQFLESCRRQFGDTFTVRLGNRPPTVLTGDPGLVKEVFAGDPDVFHAGPSKRFLKPTLGESSLLLLDGPRHRRDRKLMMPAFHAERMQAYARMMRERADASIDRWPVGRVFRLQTQLQDITLDVILRAVFGLDDDTRGRELRRALVDLRAMGDHVFWFLLLIRKDGTLRPHWLQALVGRLISLPAISDMVERVHRELLAEMARRRSETGVRRDDVLSMLLEARDEDGGSLSDMHVVDEMKSLLQAGHETTSPALTWVTLELIRNPDVLARLREEIPRGDEYLDAVINEALRMHPIVPMVTRTLQADVEIGGRLYPKGVTIAPSIYLIHYNPKIWPDPSRFDPERFLGAKPSPHEFFPFGGSNRRCIGMAFAWLEMRTVIRQLALRTKLRFAPGYQPSAVQRSVTLSPGKGLPVIREA